MQDLRRLLQSPSALLAFEAAGRLQSFSGAAAELNLTQAAIRLEPISPSIAIDAGQLPGGIHGDPADRIIIATSRHLGCPLLTTDRKILAYAAIGHLKAIDARR